MADAPKKKKPANEPKSGDAPKAGKAGKGGGGSTLDLGLGHAVRPALMSGIPASAFALWCLYGWQQQPVLRHPFTASDGRDLALIFGGVGLFTCVAWVLLPLAHWVRRVPAERFASGNKAAWFIPLLAATPVWIALYIAVIGCLALAGAAIITGLLGLGLGARWHAVMG